MSTKNLTSFRLGLIGAFTLVGTIIFRWGVVEYSINSRINQKLKLEPGTELWRIWTEMPIPMFSSFYLFNVTNPDQVSKGAKPILNELGPYVYEEKRRKIILSVNDREVKYRPKVTYFFRPDLSYGKEDDTVTLLNVPFVGIAKVAWEISKQPLILGTLDDLLAEKGEKLFHSNKVREYLFDGVSIESYMEILSLPVAQMAKGKIKIPKRLLDGDFGFFDDRNGTAEEVWVIRTGKGDTRNFGKVVSFNGMTKQDVWGDEKCDTIIGTDGTIFPPFSDKSKPLYVYHPDVCRSLPMEFLSPGDFQGLSTLRFTFAPKLFESLKLHPENECFCKDTFEWCEKGGVIPLGPCFGGAPLFLSKPHFSESNKDYWNAVEGLSESGDYSSYIDVEPTTGLPVRASIRLQINVELESYAEMTTFVEAPNMMFPLLWMEQTAHLTEDLIKPFQKLASVQHICNVIAGIGLFASLICIIGSFALEGTGRDFVRKVFRMSKA